MFASTGSAPRRVEIPLLDPGSPAQASLPIAQLPRERSRTGLPDCAARGFAGLSPRPACFELRSENRNPRRKPSDVPRPFLGRPLLRPALLTEPQIPRRRPGNPGTASRLRKIDSSGASYRLTPKRTRGHFLLPAGGDRTFGHLPLFPAVAGSLERPGPPSRSQVAQCTPRPSRKSEKWGEKPVDNGDIGNNRRNLFPNAKSAGLGCRSVPLLLIRERA